MIRLKVKEVAEAKGVNKAQLARRADIGTTTVHELWENTRSANVRIGTLSIIARVLGVKACDLFEEIGETGDNHISANAEHIEGLLQAA